MIRCFCFVVLLGGLSACQPQENVLSVVKVEDLGLFASGEIGAAGQANFSPFRIEMEENEENYTQLFWDSRPAQSIYDATYYVSLFPSDRKTSSWRFALQFFSDDLRLGNFTWSAADLEAFFPPGKTFGFGFGNNKVNVSLLLPHGGPTYDLRASRSTFLNEPEGELTIMSIEDFSYPLSSTDERHGKLIRCTFSGQIGRYDAAADPTNGTGYFQTDEVMEIRNGEVLFWAAYNN